MSWVKYAKTAQKHQAARKVKRELTKLIEKYKDTDLNFFIELTGKERHDKDTFRYYERSVYSKLAADIQTTEKDNDEHGYDGYYTSRHLKMLSFIQDIQKLDKFVQNEYCLYEQTDDNGPKFKKIE